MFTYVRAESLDHALETLAGAEDDLKVLAGGQSLLPMVGLGLARPSRLLDIGRHPRARRDVGRGRGGAASARSRPTRTSSDQARRWLRRLPSSRPRRATSATRPIRERGTFGGSLAHGDPAAEWPAVAVALDADLVAALGPRGASAARSRGLPRAADDGHRARRARHAGPMGGGPGADGGHGPGARLPPRRLRGRGRRRPRSRSTRTTDPARRAWRSSASAGRPSGPTGRRRPCSRWRDALAAAGAAAAEAADPVTDATASAEYRRRMVGGLHASGAVDGARARRSTAAARRPGRRRDAQVGR